MTEAVIVGAVRTPMGRHHGNLKDVRPDDLAALVVGDVVRRAGLDPAIVEEVYLGCASARLRAQSGTDSMGKTAESRRERNPKISREDRARFAWESHRRAIAASDAGSFATEIVAVPTPQKAGGLRLVSREEPPRPD